MTATSVAMATGTAAASAVAPTEMYDEGDTDRISIDPMDASVTGSADAAPDKDVSAAAVPSVDCRGGADVDAASEFFAMTSSLDKALQRLSTARPRADTADETVSQASMSTGAGSGSTTTARYFEPSDFLPQQNWEYLTQQLVDRDSVGPLGVAMVAAGSVACFHPLVFVAGVITAFGTLHAAGAAHDWCNGGSAAAANTTANTTTAAAVTASPAARDGNHGDGIVDLDSTFCYCFPFTSYATTATPTTSAVAVGAHDTKKTDLHGQQPSQSANGGTSTDNNHDESCSASNSSTCADHPKAYTYRQMSQITFSDDSIIYPPTTAGTNVVPQMSLSPSPLPSPEQMNSQHVGERTKGSSRHRRKQMDAKSALEFVKQYYPPLDVQSSIQNVEFHGLTAREFFDVFFADDAPFGFEAFHKIRKDKDVEYGQWETLNDVLKPCLLPTAPSKSDVSNPSTAMPPIQERVVKYEARTNSMFGPPFAPTTKVQRAMQVSKKMLVLEVKTTLREIPFANRFYLMERWVVTSESQPNDQKSGGSGKFKSASCAYLTVTSQVFFTQSCPFESTVHKESSKQINDICTQWNKMAQEALKLTEQTRRQRLQEEKMENLEDDDDDDEDGTAGSSEGDQSLPTSSPPIGLDEIEIEHIGRQQSWVVGDARPQKHADQNGVDNPITALASIVTDPDVVVPHVRSSSSSWRSTFQRREASGNSNNADKAGPRRRLSKSISNMIRTRVSSSGSF